VLLLFFLSAAIAEKAPRVFPEYKGGVLTPDDGWTVVAEAPGADTLVSAFVWSHFSNISFVAETPHHCHAQAT